MQSNAYPPLANVPIPVQSRFLTPSCCPDKDLVLLISRLGGLDRLSLWNSNSGAKVWETDVGDEGTNVDVVDVAWSPDGQSIAIILNPPRISLHSIQDGRPYASLPVQELPGGKHHHTAGQLSRIWWYPPTMKATKPAVIPDIFGRNNIVTGSSESILKNLPYLDALPEESDNLTATNLFAFQGSQTRSQSKSQLPQAIASWPTLSPDSKSPLVDSTILHQSSIKDAEPLDKKDEANLGSVLMVSDTHGKLYSYLDGAFPLGVVDLDREASFATLEKASTGLKFFGHAKFNSVSPPTTSIAPTIIDMPLLANRKVRDIARLSSIVRDLTWYIMRVVREMKELWFGSEGLPGAREIGPRWIAALRTKQRVQFGLYSADPILDLTWLLTTGKASDALADFLGSSEQMSERALQKWESSVADGLAQIRDHCEKRLTPAFQRCLIVFQELQGWRALPENAAYALSNDGPLDAAMEYCSRGVVLASWLATLARRENYRFKEFLVWLRFEISRINAPTESHPIRHDITEVNEYFIKGLVASEVDLWFEGDNPTFDPAGLGVPEPKDEEAALAEAVLRAREAIKNPAYMEWQENIQQNDHSSISRNLVKLVDDLAVKATHIFSVAGGATSRSAEIHLAEPYVRPQQPSEEPIVREMVTSGANGNTVHFLVLAKDHDILLFVQIRHGLKGSAKVYTRFSIAHLLHNEHQSDAAKILAAEYFDSTTVAVVYQGGRREAYISMLDFSTLPYTNVPYKDGSSLEDLVQGAINGWKTGNIASNAVVLTRRRLLTGCKHGEAKLAVNGRPNRRVACVVDPIGNRLESFDLADEGEEMEEEE